MDAETPVRDDDITQHQPFGQPLRDFIMCVPSALLHLLFWTHPLPFTDYSFLQTCLWLGVFHFLFFASLPGISTLASCPFQASLGAVLSGCLSLFLRTRSVTPHPETETATPFLRGPTAVSSYFYFSYSFTFSSLICRLTEKRYHVFCGNNKLS